MFLRKKWLLPLLFLGSFSAGFGADFYWELDQMLCLKVGLEQKIGPRWGVKGSLGFSPLGITLLSYDGALFYRLKEGPGPFRLTAEGGLNVAYVDLLEGNLVDWNEYVEGPYAGFVPGINLNWGYALKGGVLGLKTGILYATEYQRGSGWREPIVLPEVTLEYRFYSKGTHRRGRRQ
ncbi:MAG: hypothetical protein PQJ60_00695 [Spirochaetales bacterium]|nr:hypothetical protein [Spirochaetales bacterium]